MPRVGKFVNLFRRPGQRVIVDYQGDIVVRPSPHEVQLRSGALRGIPYLAAPCSLSSIICSPAFMFFTRMLESTRPATASPVSSSRAFIASHVGSYLLSAAKRRPCLTRGICVNGIN